jgi:hypothetical protein
VPSSADALVVIYNAPFDAGFLRFELDASAEVRCAMREFAEVFGEWSDWHGSYRWQKLHVAAAYVGFDWDGASHRRSTIARPRGQFGGICATWRSGPGLMRCSERIIRI